MSNISTFLTKQEQATFTRKLWSYFLLTETFYEERNEIDEMINITFWTKLECCDCCNDAFEREIHETLGGLNSCFLANL